MTSLILLTGFLGAGKTTLMKRLLDCYREKRIGVIINEFGSINIDARLVETDGVQMAELSNGSIFCACIKDRFVDSLIDMAARNLEYLFIEASGLADPASMEIILAGISHLTDNKLLYRGSICIADAENYRNLADLLPAIRSQTEYADAVILNKTDLIDCDDLEKVESLANAISVTMNPLYSFLAYAEKAELSKDGSIASKYQKSLLPQKLPVINGLQIGCFSNPVENVCGDYYDVLVARRNKLSFVMADVAGKGMNSLVVMIMIRAILRLAVNTDQAASTILSWANRGICLESSKIDHFASVALINYNTTTKQAQIATCGNNPVYHFNAAANTLSQISTPSEPMGVEKDTVYSDINITLNKKEGIGTNEQLAFARAIGVQHYIEKELSSFEKMNRDYEYHIEVSKEEGSKYRRISVHCTFIDAF